MCMFGLGSDVGIDVWNGLGWMSGLGCKCGDGCVDWPKVHPSS